MLQLSSFYNLASQRPLLNEVLFSKPFNQDSLDSMQYINDCKDHTRFFTFMLPLFRSQGRDVENPNFLFRVAGLPWLCCI